ncbi:hypothetical protein B4Q13_19060, partial [Lacticaseibacillus rhamnosus]
AAEEMHISGTAREVRDGAVRIAQAGGGRCDRQLAAHQAGFADLGSGDVRDGAKAALPEIGCGDRRNGRRQI